MRGACLAQQAAKGWGGLGSEACGAIGTDGHGREFEGLPIDGGPDRNRPLLLADFVGANGVAHRHIADDAAAHVLPDGLDVQPVTEADRGAANISAVLPGDPRPLYDADHVFEVEGVMRIEQRRATIEAGEIDMGRVEGEDLLVNPS